MFSLFGVGCSLNPSYDEVIDKSVNDIAVKTETVLAKADSKQLSTKEQNEYFAASLGTVRAMKARASLIPKNEIEVEMLGSLETRLKNLADRKKPLRRSIATALRLSILDLQKVQSAKKRSQKVSDSIGNSE